MRSDRDMMILIAWLAAAGLAVGIALWSMFSRFEPVAPGMLWGLVAVAALAVLAVVRERRGARTIVLPTLPALLKVPAGPRPYLRPLPLAASLAGCALLMLALARPQSSDSWQDVEREGIDIIIAMDISASMLARDLKPDRLEASKRVAAEFIRDRPNDRIGLVVYEGEAFTQCPLTTDHRVLIDLFGQVRSGLIEGGTAIGMGLATALNRLRESEARSKVVILLTDGVNNAGTLQPMDAARIAEALGVRVYTIGVGTRGKAWSPVQRYANGQYRFDYVDVEMDEPLLERIANLTGGRYFRATNENKLREIYREIDRMEKTRMKVTEHSRRREEYLPFALAGACCLLGGFLLERTLLRGMA
jgi:Ca-activated chloride channel family protein